MKAELKSGEIVTLEKDCNCVTHNDPHWTYADRVARKLNREMFYAEGKTPEQRYCAVCGMAIEEPARLQQKIRDMERRGIVRLIPEESDEMTDIQRVQLEHNRQDALRGLEAKLPAPVKSPDAARIDHINARDEVREKAKAAL
jgi:hypothetical protein